MEARWGMWSSMRSSPERKESGFVCLSTQAPRTPCCPRSWRSGSRSPWPPGGLTSGSPTAAESPCVSVPYSFGCSDAKRRTPRSSALRVSSLYSALRPSRPSAWRSTPRPASSSPRPRAHSGQACAPAVPHVRELPTRHRQHVARALAELADDGRLEARVHLAVVAPRVLAALPVIPVDAAEELRPRAVILALDQVAGALPALRRVGGIAPRGAGIVAEPRGELEKQGRRGDLRIAP